MEGEIVALEWTYNAGRSAFRQAEFATQEVPLIVDQFRQENVAINPTYVGRVTANAAETNAFVTFLVVNRSDSRTYDFIVYNENRLTDDRALDIDVHCEWGLIPIL